MNKKVLSDKIVFLPELCTGCGGCEMVCSGAHFGEYNPLLSAIRIKTNFVDREFSISICNQCEYPSCIAACPVNAIVIDEKTHSCTIDKDKCIHCGSCVRACPVKGDYPAISISEKDNEKYIIKCDVCSGCSDTPCCVDACPTQALRLLNRKDRA